MDDKINNLLDKSNEFQYYKMRSEKLSEIQNELNILKEDNVNKDNIISHLNESLNEYLQKSSNDSRLIPPALKIPQYEYDNTPDSSSDIDFYLYRIKQLENENQNIKDNMKRKEYELKNELYYKNEEITSLKNKIDELLIENSCKKELEKEIYELKDVIQRKDVFLDESIKEIEHRRISSISSVSSVGFITDAENIYYYEQYKASKKLRNDVNKLKCELEEVKYENILLSQILEEKGIEDTIPKKKKTIKELFEGFQKIKHQYDIELNELNKKNKKYHEIITKIENDNKVMKYNYESIKSFNKSLNKQLNVSKCMLTELCILLKNKYDINVNFGNNRIEIERTNNNFVENDKSTINECFSLKNSIVEKT